MPGEISDKITARSFTRNCWQLLSKNVSTHNSVLKNWATTVKDLRETPGPWFKWNTSKLVEERRLNIFFDKGFLIVQSLRDLVCYVVDLSDVPKCGSFNPYGNEQMAEKMDSIMNDIAKLLSERSGKEVKYGEWKEKLQKDLIYDKVSLLEFMQSEDWSKYDELPKGVKIQLEKLLGYTIDVEKPSETITKLDDRFINALVTKFVDELKSRFEGIANETSGTTGNSGADWTSGTSGNSGTDWTSGTSGTSGSTVRRRVRLLS
jgi:hypothetical protein